MGLDPGTVEAIDTHVHVESDGHGHTALDQQLLDASARYFKSGVNRTPALDEISDNYRQRRLAAVVFTVDAHTATGHAALSSEDIVTQAAAHADVLIPFASVDPHDGPSAVARLRDLAAAGAQGLKLHPSLQAFVPSDRTHYPLYETAAELGLPVIFHTGQTGIGAGLPGGRGIKLRYSDPMLIDDVAADHPALTIVLAHPSVPWQDAAISIATHKANVYIDLSGWSPKYFPPQLIRAANGLLRHKVLFGSDYPVLTPDRWLADFAALDIKPDVRPLILRANAITMLGLDVPGAAGARLRRRQLAVSPGADQPRTGRATPGRPRTDLPAAGRRGGPAGPVAGRPRHRARGPRRLPRPQRHRRVRGVLRDRTARRDLRPAEHAADRGRSRPVAGRCPAGRVVLQPGAGRRGRAAQPAAAAGPGRRRPAGQHHGPD
jgi:hypothetical protein